MRALRFHNFGSPSSVLRFEEIPTSTAGGGELLVQLRAAAINPSDVWNVEGRFSQTTLPRTPGRDFSGIIASKGQYSGKEATVLVAPYTADQRSAAMVQFPGGYIAEIHAQQK